MDFGTAVHETIECFCSRSPVPGVDTDVAVFLFREKFRYLFDRNRGKYSERDLEYDQKKYSDPTGFFLEAGERIIRAFSSCVEISTAEVLYNEHRLHERIDRDDVEIFFKGFIDLVVKAKDKRGKTILWICDFKTCSFGWDREKRRDQNLHAQLFLYKHFLCKKFDLDPSLVRTAFVLLKKRPPKDVSPIEWFPISAGPISVQRSLDRMNSDISRMVDRTVNETWKKDREKCVNSFGDRCPHYDTERCPGRDPKVEEKLLEISAKKSKKKEKQPATRPAGKMTTEELRARLFGKKK